MALHDARGDAHLAEEAANRWFAALEPPDRALLLPGLVQRRAARGEVLMEPGARRAALLPCGATIASVSAALPDGGRADAALVGAEAMLAPVDGVTAWRAVARIPGPFLLLDAELLRDAANRSPSLRDALARASDILLAELMATAACNIVHDLRQRLARWLLAVSDRQPDGRVRLTQSYLAHFLGVQRTTVSAAAAALAAEGVIRYRRGVVDVPDREALAKAACPCHAAARAHADRVMPSLWANHGAAEGEPRPAG